MGRKPKARKIKSKDRSEKRSDREAAAKTQSERFIEAARAIGVDESGKEFERALKRIVPSKSPSRRMPD
jgi:hypothetical protein